MFLKMEQEETQEGLGRQGRLYPQGSEAGLQGPQGTARESRGTPSLSHGPSWHFCRKHEAGRGDSLRWTRVDTPAGFGTQSGPLGARGRGPPPPRVPNRERTCGSGWVVCCTRHHPAWALSCWDDLAGPGRGGLPAQKDLRCQNSTVYRISETV